MEDTCIKSITQKGIFKYVIISKTDCKKMYPVEKTAKEFSSLDSLHPFISVVEGTSENIGGTEKGRLWIDFKGNFKGDFAFPESYFGSKIHAAFFPYISLFAIIDTLNKYAPGEYMFKYPNDIICKKHTGKTCGSAALRNYGYLMCLYSVNFVAYPKDEILRKEGLHACCLKRHTDKIPTFEDFVYECAMRTLEINKEYDTIDKLCDLSNRLMGEYTPKIFSIEINNRFADIDKDGITWCSSFPNALTKCYLNGIPYDLDNNFFDNGYIPRVADDPKAYEELNKKIQELHKNKREEE